MPVDELASDLGRHARQLAVDELVRLALDAQRQRALEDDVDLLLVLVAVDPAALAGPQQEHVQPERADAQLSAQPLEALVVLEVHTGERDAALHAADYGRRRSWCPGYRSRAQTAVVWTRRKRVRRRPVGAGISSVVVIARRPLAVAAANWT